MLRTEYGTWGTEDATLHFQYLRHQDERKRPIMVFLHDALGSIPQWRNFPELLALHAGLDALVYERRGHGQSAPLNGQRTAGYLHDQAIRTLPHLLRSLDISNPILIGHSDGGTIALLYAGKNSARMVITIGAHVLIEPITRQGIRQAVGQKTHLLERLEKYHGDKTGALFNAWADTWLDSQFQDWNIAGELQSIQCPVLAIQGTEDEYASEAQFLTLSQNLGKKASTLWIEKAGHFPHLTHTEFLVSGIANFIHSRLMETAEVSA